MSVLSANFSNGQTQATVKFSDSLMAMLSTVYVTVLERTPAKTLRRKAAVMKRAKAVAKAPWLGLVRNNY